MSPPPSPLLQILLATTSDPHLQVVIVLCLIKVISYMNFNGCKNKYFPLDVKGGKVCKPCIYKCLS